MDKTVIRVLNAYDWHIICKNNIREWVEHTISEEGESRPSVECYLEGCFYKPDDSKHPRTTVRSRSNPIVKFFDRYVITDDTCYYLEEPNVDYADWLKAMEAGESIIEPTRITGSRRQGYILEGTVTERHPEGSVVKIISAPITKQEGNYIWFKERKYFVKWYYLRADMMANTHLNVGYLDLFFPSDFEEVVDEYCRPKLAGKL